MICSASPSGGNQVDGLPPASSFVRCRIPHSRFGRDYLIPQHQSILYPLVMVRTLAMDFILVQSNPQSHVWVEKIKWWKWWNFENFEKSRKPSDFNGNISSEPENFNLIARISFPWLVEHILAMLDRVIRRQGGASFRISNRRQIYEISP